MEAFLYLSLILEITLEDLLSLRKTYSHAHQYVTKLYLFTKDDDDDVDDDDDYDGVCHHHQVLVMSGRGGSHVFCFPNGFHLLFPPSLPRSSSSSSTTSHINIACT